MQSGRGHDDFPFTLHLDMNNLPYYNDCENKKLETVCTYIFREKVRDIEVLPGSFRVYLEKSFMDLTELLDMFMIGIKVKCFHLNNVAKKSTMFFESRLTHLLWRSYSEANYMEKPYELLQYDDVEQVALIHKTAASKKVQVCFQILRNADVGEIPKSHTDLYISVGKTSDISRLSQQCWKSVMDVIETIYYCHVDVLLTGALELKLKAFLDIYNSNYLENFPFMLPGAASGQKVLKKIAKTLMREVFVVNMATPLQAHLYFDSALAVEGVRATVPDCAKTENPNILALSVNEFAEDLLNLESNNMNEYYMGLTGENPLDDLNVVEDNIAKLLNNVLALKTVTRKKSSK